jgi:hypothetical protein
MYDTSAKVVNRLRILLEQEQKKMQNKGILKAFAFTSEYYGVDIFSLTEMVFYSKERNVYWCSTIKLQR